MREHSAPGETTLGLRAFNEDRTMIEAQQKNINLSPESKMITIAIDSGASQFRRMMNEMMLAESSAAPSKAATES